MMSASLSRLIMYLIFSTSLMMTSCRDVTEDSEEQTASELAEPAGPRSQPDTKMGIYIPEQHELYSGRFILSAAKIYQVGRLSDPPGWDHIDDEAQRVYPVDGTVDIDVNETEDTGTFIAILKVPEGELVLQMDRFHEFSPCQNGGVSAYIFEHGDSGCGDSNWPNLYFTWQVGDTVRPS